MVFETAQKVTKYLGYLGNKIRYQKFQKMLNLVTLAFTI